MRGHTTSLARNKGGDSLRTHAQPLVTSRPSEHVMDTPTAIRGKSMRNRANCSTQPFQPLIRTVAQAISETAFETLPSRCLDYKN
eukprot:1017332-Pleurochrysis_carterae.AAC.1